MKRISALIVALAILSTSPFAQAERMLSTGNAAQTALAQKVASTGLDHDSDDMTELKELLRAEVEAEIADEAKALNQNSEQYLASDRSFEALIRTVEGAKLNQMSQTDRMISLLKLGIRFQAQVGAEELGPNHLANTEKFMNVMRPYIEEMTK